ncbi:hypothetical protein TNCV_656751 [Trichonephila clavipes]|nr:hypothetical protein TNCV_656751 [Trichonephila clavipes]
MGSRDKKLFYEKEFGILNASSEVSWGNAENGKSFSGGVVLLGLSEAFNSYQIIKIEDHQAHESQRIFSPVSDCIQCGLRVQILC